MENILHLAEELSFAIENSDVYKNYLETKTKIVENPSLISKIKEFKRVHLDYQARLLQHIQPSFEEEQHVSRLYSELLLDEDASVFFESEKTVLETVIRIQNIVGKSCKIDMDF